MELIQLANLGDLDGVKRLIQSGVCVNTRNRCNQTALYFACEKGRTAVAWYLLENGASASLGAKPLITAVRNDHYECAKLLLEHYATVHCTNTKGESPMSVAVQKHHYSVILLLLAYGAIPPASLGCVAIKLLKHAKLEHAKVVQKLIDQEIIDLTSENIFVEAFDFAFKCGSVELAENMLSKESYSKIHQLYPYAAYYSARNNWPTILSKLFEKGVNINALTDGKTALYTACKEGHEIIVTLLLDNGADPNVKNELNTVTALNDFSLPLQVAVQRGNVAIFNTLLQRGAKIDQPGEPLLHVACGTAATEWKTERAAETRSAEHTVSVVTLLLQHGAKVNAVSHKGDTALYRACERQRLEVVRILLEAGADVNCTSNRCYPLLAACSTGNVELINLLVSAGADVKCSNSSNETCFHVLIRTYSSIADSEKHADGDSMEDILSVIKLLLQVGADVNACSLQEETALHQASKGGHEDIVRLLLDAGAETNGSSTYRPLYAACERGYTEIVDMLLQHGADSNASSTHSHSSTVPVLSRYLASIMGMTTYVTSSLPICCAVKKGCEDIVKLLLKHGADVNQRDQSGKSALIYIVELLASQQNKPSEVVNTISREMGFSFLKYVLLAGGDVTESLGNDNLNPIHIASSVGMCDLMIELIQHGANCNQLTLKGVSALDLACSNGHEAAVELLLKNGAKPDKKTVNRPTRINYMHTLYSGQELHSKPPLLTAAKNGSATIVKTLLKYGANVNASSEKGDTALHVATSQTVIEILLNAKADVNARNDNGETPLSIVCEKHQPEVNVAKLLLTTGADPNVRFLLHTACKKNDTDTVKLLLAYGADANIVKKQELSHTFAYHCMTDAIEPSPLCIACKNGNVAIVDCLLKNGADVAFADSNGNTALHCAIERLGYRANSEEYGSIVTLLLLYDAPVNVVSDKGETPLYMACMKGLTNVIKQLLDCRAYANFTGGNSNKYPLLIACEKKHRDIAVMLLDRGAAVNVSNDHQTPLKFASANGDAELVHQLLRHGAVVNLMQNFSDTALHVAVDRCKDVGSEAFVDVAQRLLESKAEPNVLNGNHETPLYLACRLANDDVNIDVVQALLKCGADPNACPPCSKDKYCVVDDVISPLSAACRRGNSALVSLLMKYGATVGHRSELGRTPLHYAIGYDNDRFTRRFESSQNSACTSIVEMLLSAGADASTMDKTGASPLYLASKRGKSEIVKLLLSHGANPNMKATDKYPMHAACNGQHYDLVKLLLEYNANIVVRDEHGETALHCVLKSVSMFPESAGSVLAPVELLLDAGADVNAMSNDGETPFYIACSKGLTSVVAKMLKYGAKVDGISDKKLPMIVACRNKNVSVVQLLLSNGANPDIVEAGSSIIDHRALPLHIAATDGSSELVDLLLKHGSKIDISDAHGNTALHYAIERYQSRTTTSRYSHKGGATSNAESVVNILLENKADVNILNKSGETPMYRAVSRGLLDFVSTMLQRYGGNPNTSSLDKNMLVAACEKRNVELVAMLLKHGADPNPVSVSWYSYSISRLPLCTAVMQGNSDEIIELLIKAGADVNAKNSEGKTALCISIETMTKRCNYTYIDEKKKLSTVRLLLERGADLNVLLPDGRSLLYLVVCTIAVAQKRNPNCYTVDLQQLMVQHGAILSDSFSLSRQHTSLHSQKVLRDLATFEGKHEFIVDLFRAGAGFHMLAFCCNAVATVSGAGKSISLCQAAVLAGYMPNAAERQDLQLAAEGEHMNSGILGQLVKWLNEDRQQVPNLLRQCRVVVRQQLSIAVNHRSILPAIDKLPLPNRMKMYLQFDGTLTEVDLSINKELCSTETLTENRSTENRNQLMSLMSTYGYPFAYDYDDTHDNYDLEYDFYYYDRDSDNDLWYQGSDSDDY